MTSNIKITRDLHVGGGCRFRARWANKKKAASRNPACSSAVSRRLRRLAKRASAIARTIEIPSYVLFPPATPCNTTQLWMDRFEAHEQDQLDQDQDFTYGSMAELMNGPIAQSCRMNVVSESMDSNMNKFTFLGIA